VSPGATGSDGHPDDELSALVDGELDPATEAWVAEHLDGCPACRQATEELAQARSVLRGLPPVDATPVVEGFLARHRRMVRLGAGFVVVAGLVLAAVGVTAATEHPRLVPDLAALTAGHVEQAHGEMAGMERQARSAYAAPPGLIGSKVQLSRQEVWDGTDLAAVVYRDGAVDVSVYQQPGRLDWSGLPPGEVATVGDRAVWFGDGDPVVAVTQRGDLVVTVVSGDRPALLTAVAGMPEWQRRATWDRVHDACQRLVRVFALEG
jgi:anti-sigma factor RsiW